MSDSNPPVRKREIFGWCCYDFANSAFITVVITVVFPPFFIATVAGDAPGCNSWWSGILAVGQLLVIVFGPVLGVMADVTASKKKFLLWCMWTCAGATALLWFTGPGTVALAVVLVVVAYAAFSFGENFCASFLSELSTPANCGRISAYGWSFGYFGGLGALALALGILYAWPGREQWVYVSTAVFMLAATVPVVLLLKERKRPESHAGAWWSLGWEGIGRAARDLPGHRDLLRFLIAFLLYLSGLNAVVAFAAIFAAKVLGFTDVENIALFILLQLSSVVGALACGWLQDRAGSIRALTVSLLLWCCVALGAWFCTTKGSFFLIGNIAGFAMGSSQAAGRAVVSILSPRERAAEFFGFWGVFGKLAGIVGPVSIGLLADVSGLRFALVATIVFFIAGLLVLRTVRMPDPRTG